MDVLQIVEEKSTPGLMSSCMPAISRFTRDNALRAARQDRVARPLREHFEQFFSPTGAKMAVTAVFLLLAMVININFQ